MNKIVIILHIEEQLYYQVYPNGEDTNNVFSKEIDRDLEDAVRKILNELKDTTEVGVIIIDKNQETQRIIEKLQDIELLQKYDSYKSVMKGNNFSDYESWCIIDGLLENVIVYDLKDNQRAISLNKQEAKNNLYNGVIDKTFTSEKPKVNEKEKESIVDEWIQTLKVQKELRGNRTIGNKTEFFNIDYKQAATWLFGNFINDIFNKFPDKTIFYFLDDFVNHTILFEQIAIKGYKKEFKSKSESYQFIINGAYELFKKQTIDNLDDIDIQIHRPQAEIKKLYESNHIRYFNSFDKFKNTFIIIDIDKERKKIVKLIQDELGKSVVITEDLKEELLKQAKEPHITSKWVEDEIDKHLERNIEVINERVIVIINKNFKNRGFFTTENSVKKKTLKDLNDVDTKGLPIDRDKILEQQWQDLEVFYSEYKDDPTRIDPSKLPNGIDSTDKGKHFVTSIIRKEKQSKFVILGSIVGIILITLGFIIKNIDNPFDGGKNVIIVDEVREDEVREDEVREDEVREDEVREDEAPEFKFIKNNYSKNPELLQEAFKVIHDSSTRSSISKKIATKISNDLKGWKINATVIEDIAGNSIFQRNYSLEEFTKIIRGDRRIQTIKNIKINSIDNQIIQITLKRIN